jgi:predicted short-subunit dehydrogenase-like oxidoreductase (DUF2520 family)
MLQVVIIGSGNVAQHLIRSFSTNAEVQLKQVFARQPEGLLHLLPADKITGSYNEIVDADIYIIAVSDDAISEVSAQLKFDNRLVVHTSGSAALEAISNQNRRGVFYPLQTFSKNKAVDFTAIPICIESEFDEDLSTLKNLGYTLTKNVYDINSAQRRALHIAAVFVNNFTNHLYSIGYDLCKENEIPFDILKPLILETADKINTLTPLEAQTGPAVRNDINTIQRHLDKLNDENQKDIYTLLTKSIQKAHEQKL